LLGNLEPRQGLFNLFCELGKGRRSEGEEEKEESNSSQQLPLSIERRLIIQWRWMPEAEENEENEKENPSRIFEDSDVGHDGDGEEEDNSALLSKESIGNVASV